MQRVSISSGVAARARRVWSIVEAMEEGVWVILMDGEVEGREVLVWEIRVAQPSFVDGGFVEGAIVRVSFV